MCPTAGYNHTMQARTEGAICTTKEHVRCMMKQANMPYRFWPWAVIQFCRIFNYWPTKSHAPPWTLLEGHCFSTSLHRDLHPFGCYVIGKLPRDHPLVTNTTNSDRGLEGAFLGWDLKTLTVWIWSFKKRAPVRLHYQVFFDRKFPFRDPNVLVNRELSAAEVKRMHDKDSTNLVCPLPSTLTAGEDSEEEDRCSDLPVPPAPSVNPFPSPASPSASTNRARPMTRSQIRAAAPAVEGPEDDTPEAHQASVKDPS
eukprot:2424071-Rhodomonas_salina.1